MSSWLLPAGDFCGLAPKANISVAVIHKLAEGPAPTRHNSRSKLVNNCAAGDNCPADVLPRLDHSHPEATARRFPKDYWAEVDYLPLRVVRFSGAALQEGRQLDVIEGVLVPYL
jgi:hypothetical protein